MRDQSSDRVYVDHNATTPPDPRVVDAMMPFLTARHGNPSSIHAHGQQARGALENAREAVARLVGARSPEIVFTASGTEANNAVLRSVFGRFEVGGHLVMSAFEHPSIESMATLLEAHGVAVTRVPPERDGVVDVDRLTEAIRPDTKLLALMLANNEIGTLQPVEQVAARCRQAGVLTLCDAVQAVGKIAVDVEALGVDFLTLGAHKFHGPLGAAALVVRGKVGLESHLVGGSQERHRRASTENLAAIVGLGEASRLAHEELESRQRKLSELRDRFERGLASIDGAEVRCQQSPRLPNTSHVGFAGVAGETLLMRLDLAGYSVSTGSACASGSLEPSPTLLTLGASAEEALSSIRVSFGMTNRCDEVDRLLEQLAHDLAELRSLEALPPKVAAR